ncbi:MAG: hypothetical protein H7232_13445 [Aeromicrobium sp.]|nr:hypothetical protein [Burkholderiales bacterium]
MTSSSVEEISDSYAFQAAEFRTLLVVIAVFATISSTAFFFGFPRVAFVLSVFGVVASCERIFRLWSKAPSVLWRGIAALLACLVLTAFVAFVILTN